jgi:hypothetical protein
MNMATFEVEIRIKQTFHVTVEADDFGEAAATAEQIVSVKDHLSDQTNETVRVTRLKEEKRRRRGQHS